MLILGKVLMACCTVPFDPQKVYSKFFKGTQHQENLVLVFVHKDPQFVKRLGPKH